MPHAALCVVQPAFVLSVRSTTMFQCRTRLCVWCSTLFPDAKMTGKVSMPHAALCVVQLSVVLCYGISL